jgi:predicted lipid-binding transport protein (Tim44 family)
MRWLLLLIAVVGFAVAFTSGSPGLLALGLLIGLAALFGFTLAMAAARIAETAQPAANLIADAEVSAMRARANQKKKAALTQPQTAHRLSAEDQGNPTRG